MMCQQNLGYRCDLNFETISNPTLWPDEMSSVPRTHSHIYKTEQLVKFLLLDRVKGRRYGFGVCAGGLS